MNLDLNLNLDSSDDNLGVSNNAAIEDDIKVRKYTETICSTFSALTSVLDFPKGKIVSKLRKWIHFNLSRNNKRNS